ncbi:MAG: hypothetical protein ACD_63C00145G0002, partial [uncultured bacterium]
KEVGEQAYQRQAGASLFSPIRIIFLKKRNVYSN